MVGFGVLYARVCARELAVREGELRCRTVDKGSREHSERLLGC